MSVHRIPRLVALIAVLAACPGAAPASAVDPPAAYVDRLFDRLVAAALAGGDAGGVIEDAIDLGDLARSASGPLWDTGSPADQAETRRLLRAVLAARVADAAPLLRRVDLTVLDAHALEAGVTVVRTEVVRPGFVPVRIDWRLRDGASGFRVEDVVIEGLSVRTLMRVAAARLDHGGTSLAGLNAAIAALAAGIQP